MSVFFFFNDTATTEIYTLSLHDALPILISNPKLAGHPLDEATIRLLLEQAEGREGALDRKSTRLNSSHANISYAVFCLKKKKNNVHLSSNLYLTIIPQMYSSLLSPIYTH